MDLVYIEPVGIFYLIMLALVFKMLLNRMYLIQINHLDKGLKYPLWNIDFWDYTIQGIWRLWFKKKTNRFYTELLRYIANLGNILFIASVLLGLMAFVVNWYFRNL